MSGAADLGAFEKAKSAFRRRNLPEHRHDRDWNRASRAYLTAARARFDASPSADTAIDLLAAAFDVGGLRSEEPSKSSVGAVARFHRERMQEIVSETPADEDASTLPTHDARQLRLIRELLEAHGQAIKAEQAYSEAVAQHAWESYAYGELAKKNIVYAERRRAVQDWTSSEDAASPDVANDARAPARSTASKSSAQTQQAPTLFG